MTTTLSQRLRLLRGTWANVLEMTSRMTLLGEVDTFTDELSDCIAQAEAMEGQAGELSDEELQHRALRWSCDNDQSVFTYSQSLAAFGKHLRDHGYIRPSQAIGEQTPVAWMSEESGHIVKAKELKNMGGNWKAVYHIPLYHSPISPEARDMAIDGLAKDAVDLIKVLANQIHGLPQASITALSHRTFSEMFDTANGAAYGQAKSIVDRFQALSALRA